MIQFDMSLTQLGLNLSQLNLTWLYSIWHYYCPI